MEPFIDKYSEIEECVDAYRNPNMESSLNEIKKTYIEATEKIRQLLNDIGGEAYDNDVHMAHMLYKLDMQLKKQQEKLENGKEI